MRTLAKIDREIRRFAIDGKHANTIVHGEQRGQSE